MLILGVDTETTGLDPVEHRVIEIYAGLWDFGTKERIREFNQRIDPQRSILAEAQRVHGISGADLIGKPLWSDIAPTVAKLFSEADLIVWHNGDEFDKAFINAEFARCGMPPIDKPSFDTMLLGRNATPVGKVPNLGELCFAYDVIYDPDAAHAADYDVLVMMECFFKGIEQGYFKLPESVKP